MPATKLTIDTSDFSLEAKHYHSVSRTRDNLHLSPRFHTYNKLYRKEKSKKYTRNRRFDKMSKSLNTIGEVKYVNPISFKPPTEKVRTDIFNTQPCLYEYCDGFCKEGKYCWWITYNNLRYCSKCNQEYCQCCDCEEKYCDGSCKNACPCCKNYPCLKTQKDSFSNVEQKKEEKEEEKEPDEGNLCNYKHCDGICEQGDDCWNEDFKKKSQHESVKSNKEKHESLSVNEDENKVEEKPTVEIVVEENELAKWENCEKQDVTEYTQESSSNGCILQ